ncbi:hypothetical protein XCR1_4210003 [Xenorhabdus cabanillasii JM26]|uniref:Uncharacterized protein n=1 Tax=Xenorhabdus cabanillasii JM26 TaxID=1427517 RepID=W1JAM2_9GAMM|nr:hypothetical protein XCR1_4210003 [Xenorhabdus cabanillasii JM26]
MGILSGYSDQCPQICPHFTGIAKLFGVTAGNTNSALNKDFLLCGLYQVMRGYLVLAPPAGIEPTTSP